MHTACGGQAWLNREIRCLIGNTFTVAKVTNGTTSAITKVWRNTTTLTHIRRSGRDFNGVYETQLVQEAYNIYIVKSLLLTNNGCGLAQYALHKHAKDQFGDSLWDWWMSLCLEAQWRINDRFGIYESAGCALLSVKCYCFAWKPFHAILSEEKRKTDFGYLAISGSVVSQGFF